jgi:uncharacterized protein
MTVPSTRLRLRVTAGAGRNEIVGRHGDAWKVRVSAAPERGRANEALLGLLSARLGLPRSELTLLSGHTAQNKVVELRGLSGAEAVRRLEVVDARA